MSFANSTHPNHAAFPVLDDHVGGGLTKREAQIRRNLENSRKMKEWHEIRRRAVEKGIVDPGAMA